MNIYLRYFDTETLVPSYDEAVKFLHSIPEIECTDKVLTELKEYVDGPDTFASRYRVRPRVYFIAIKTEAQTMQDFKDKKALKTGIGSQNRLSEAQRLSEVQEGWYEGSLDFKRVVVNHLGKCEYRDTTFVVQCKALSPIDCYNRIVNHLKARVDSRSQFPSAKGKNFQYKYLGKCKQIVEGASETVEENVLETPETSEA